MVNNKLKRGCIAYPFLIILWLIVINACDAQNISRYYKSSVQGNSMLYFVMPKMEFESGIDGGKLNYDITYLSANDSATLNFSYFDNSAKQIDSIAFIQYPKKFSSSTKKLFVESQKFKWHHRYSSKFFFNDLIFLFNQDDRPKIFIYTKSGVNELTISQSEWKKNSDIVTEILSMIKINR